MHLTSCPHILFTVPDNRARRQSGFPTFISCQRQDANVLPKRRQSHQGDKLCDVSTVPLVAHWPVLLARGSDADGEPHYSNYVEAADFYEASLLTNLKIAKANLPIYSNTVDASLERARNFSDQVIHRSGSITNAIGDVFDGLFGGSALRCVALLFSPMGLMLIAFILSAMQFIPHLTTWLFLKIVDIDDDSNGDYDDDSDANNGDEYDSDDKEDGNNDEYDDDGYYVKGFDYSTL